MPQFAQIDTFASQIFWLFVTFTFLYIIMNSVILPRISETLANRRDKIEGDLGKAKELQAKADDLRDQYEAGLAKAAADVRALHKQVADKNTIQASEEHQALADKLAEEAEAAAARIEAVKKAALADLKSESVEVVQAATARLIDAKVDKKSVTAALKAVS